MQRIMIYRARAAIAPATLIGMVAATAAAADPAGGPYYGNHAMMGYDGWDGWIFGPFTMLLLFALLVGAVILIVRLFGGDKLRMSAPQEDRALPILRERFAKGEITQEEFEKARKALE